MRTAILLTLAALAACADPETAPVAEEATDRPEAAGAPGSLPGPDPELPPAPPLWRIDPAIDRNASLLDVVPDDPVRGVPASLRGLRISAWHDTHQRNLIRFNASYVAAESFYRHDPVTARKVEEDRRRWPGGSVPPALSREDFLLGSRACISVLFEDWEASEVMEAEYYQSAEEQTYWYASLRAKEAVYGMGAEEAACERALLEGALLVARGQWRDVFARNSNRESILEEWEEFVGWGDREYPPPDPEAAARLERWLTCDGEG